MAIAPVSNAITLLEKALSCPEKVTENEFRDILESNQSNLFKVWSGQNILHRLLERQFPVSWIKSVLSIHGIHPQIIGMAYCYIPKPLAEIVFSYLTEINREELLSQKDSADHTPSGRAKHLADLIPAQRNFYLQKAKFLEPEARF